MTGFSGNKRAAPSRPVDDPLATTAYGARFRYTATSEDDMWSTYARRPGADSTLVAAYDAAMAVACAAMAAVDELRDPAAYRRMRADLARVRAAHPRFVPACCSYHTCIIGINAANATHVDDQDARGCFSLVASLGKTDVVFALPEYELVVRIGRGCLFAFDAATCPPPPGGRGS